MYRYVAVVWNPRSAEGALAREVINQRRARSPEWSVAHEGPGIFAVHVPRGEGTAGSYRLPGRSGAIIGQLFDRRSDDYSVAREVRFDEAQAATIVKSGGQYLIDHYWGSYLAILYDEAADRHHVFRDPIGTLPCCHVKHAGADIFFSHIEDCLQLLPFSLLVNRRHLTHWLLFSSVRTDDTGLENVTHLGRGTRLTLSQAGTSCTRMWDPTIIGSEARLRQPEEATRALRSAVQSAVNAWASRYRRIVHRVSGGLDSAIVAGCLAQAPSTPEVVYLNFSVDVDPDRQTYHLPGVDAKTALKLRAIAASGDERHYARLVAQRWRVPLLERNRLASMDLARLEHAPLTVAPPMYFTAMEMDDADLELIASHRTQAFFSGQAGDALFLATQQPLPAIDHAYMHGLGRGLWQQIAATSLLSKESLWSVIGKTVQHGLLRRPYAGSRSLIDRPTLLTQELLQELREGDLDSTLARLAKQAALPPGKQGHITGIPSAFHSYVFHAGNHADHIDPLNSQPVWETALQIPTYTLLMRGVSRGLARHAFADLLPNEIRRRQTKGAGTLFYQQVVRHNRGYLLERLEGGLLVRGGYLDRSRLVACLTADEPSLTIRASVLLSYLAAETWLQRLSSAVDGYLNWEQARERQVAAG